MGLCDAVTHRCICLDNEPLEQLYLEVGVGTSVYICCSPRSGSRSAARVRNASAKVRVTLVQS